MQTLTLALAVLALQEGGLRGVIGRPDPAVAAELARDPAVVVHWLAPGPETLAPAREAVDRLGLQGRVSFDLLRPPDLITIVAILALPILIGSCQATQPAALEGMAESVLQLGDAISTLQIENALLQEQIDSLRVAVARQDTTLRQFANLAGMPLP